MSVVVSNTTPINYLILIGHADLLRDLFGEIYAAPAVLKELRDVRAAFADGYVQGVLDISTIETAFENLRRSTYRAPPDLLRSALEQIRRHNKK